MQSLTPKNCKIMIYRILPLLLLVCPSVFSQAVTEEFHSVQLNETREIIIKTPPSYNIEKNKKYPLLVLLDGEYLFDAFSGTLSYANYWNDLPEVIIAAVNQNQNNERETDCHYEEHSGIPDEKGALFFDFITLELLPQLEKKYRVAPFKIIAGHNITAGYLNFFLYKAKPVFNAYISFSPELATEMETRVPEQLAASKKPVYYYLATADGDVPALAKRIKTLHGNISSLKSPNINYSFEEFKNASHYSLVAMGIPNALYHIFSSYQPISSTEYQSKIVTLSGGYVDYLKDKYTLIENNLGIKMPVRLNDFKAIEAAILKNGAFNELRKLADLARKSYPKAMIGEYYDALYYEKTGDIKRASKTYLNSYSLNEIGDYTRDFMIRKAENLKNIPNE